MRAKELFSLLGARLGSAQLLGAGFPFRCPARGAGTATDAKDIKIGKDRQPVLDLPRGLREEGHRVALDVEVYAVRQAASQDGHLVGPFPFHVVAVSCRRGARPVTRW